MSIQKMKQSCAHIAAALLCLTAAISTSGCSQASAADEKPLDRAEQGAKQACPPGHSVEWLSKAEMQCLKEL